MLTETLIKGIKIVFFLSFSNIVCAQDRHDNTWLLGTPGSDPASLIGGNFIHFDRGIPSISYFSSNTDLWVPCVMSHENGELLWYSNGCKVQNKTHQLMDNGDGINAGAIHNAYCINTGYPSGHSLLSIPFPGHDSLFYFFHMRISEDFILIDLLNSIVDISANNGLGKVIEKDKFMLNDSLVTSISAVKHGNGRDWWLIVGDQYNDDTYVYLIDTSGIRQPPIIRHAAWFGSNAFPGFFCFSSDGRKLVRTTHGTPTIFRIYDFDRCTGLISNPIDITIPDDEAYVSWACFSPSSRYLYLTNKVTKLYQYDTWAPNISASAQLIDVYDGFVGDFNTPTTLFTMTMGPDQRIYMSANNGVRYLHTIHNPDEYGQACNFRQHDFEMPALSLFFLPNIPNYRLYNWAGSSCDTLGVEPPFLAQWRYENDSVNNPLSFVFSDVSYYEPVSWKWYFGDGDTSNLPDPLHVYSAPGKYEVCLETCNEKEICDTLCRTIEVKVLDATIPSSSQPPKNKVYLWPNPATQHLWASQNGLKSSELTLYNLTGHAVFQATFKESESISEFELPKLSSGMYFCLIRSKGSLVDIQKLVIQY
ncbi:MAG: PKD domain-containing protein [Saprospiraceae bacterium]